MFNQSRKNCLLTGRNLRAEPDSLVGGHLPQPVLSFQLNVLIKSDHWPTEITESEQCRYLLLWWSSNKVMPVTVMCHRDSDSAMFSTITLIELMWNDSSWNRKIGSYRYCPKNISFSTDWPTARLRTCDRKRSVVGLTVIFPDFSPWLFFTRGLSGACRSNLTLVSPTHNARYLLKTQPWVTVSNNYMLLFIQGLGI